MPNEIREKFKTEAAGTELSVFLTNLNQLILSVGSDSFRKNQLRSFVSNQIHKSLFIRQFDLIKELVLLFQLTENIRNIPAPFLLHHNLLVF